MYKIIINFFMDFLIHHLYVYVQRIFFKGIVNRASNVL